MTAGSLGWIVWKLGIDCWKDGSVAEIKPGPRKTSFSDFTMESLAVGYRLETEGVHNVARYMVVFLIEL